MIRYANALDGLDAALDAVSPNWRTRAMERTAVYRSLGSYTEDEWINPISGESKKLTPFWSEIKTVYMRRQFNKCVYCEKKMEGGGSASADWDLEHFRPKGRIRAWKPKRGVTQTTVYNFPLGDAADTGYYLLSYHPFNYAASCKTCNSTFKSDYFPVATARSLHHPLLEDYDGEGAYLPYPLGSRGDAPETLIQFEGAVAVPSISSDEDLTRFRRGCITIDFFGLNREGLLHARADWLRDRVWNYVLRADAGEPGIADNIAILRSEKSWFTNCTRCFLDLCASDRPKAIAMLSNLESILATEI